ncbi:MAG: TIGR01777 family oxidoreductase [Myxococcales bacterium]|nr:TIGR01777 family oxidoreductase [Myxococcales bacterium]
MKIAITGSSGLVGTALGKALRTRGDEVVALVRRAPRSAGEVRWDPSERRVDVAGLEGVDALVHLAGENIADGRWTEARKRAIRDSRVLGTEAVAQAVAELSSKPVLVSASAIGIYGDRGDAPLTEDATPGEGFLAEVCVAWEQAAEAARVAGRRVVHPRIGIVLARDGGALGKMVTPFKLGVGGVLGSGRQYMSWVHVDDLVAQLLRAIDDTSLQGPFNAVAPEAVTNAEFTKALGRAVKRPTFLPVPRFAAKLAFGSELAEEALLASARVVPEVLTERGFAWRFPSLDRALADCV